MNPILVGEAPAKNEYAPRPLEGRIGRRLADWAGLSFENYLTSFDRVNLLHVRQDTAGKGFMFDGEAAATEACRLRKEWPHGRTVILLGQRVARAFGVQKEPLFERQMYDHDFYVMPHPSGVNRWFNDPGNVAKVRTFLRSMTR